mmetsp:Transcript_14690/g.21577  ORF Transcript_14690/g.21577 Transcript_14690/m.21577 type:complete len:206 (-) Transcript_14690:127-744(-)
MYWISSVSYFAFFRYFLAVALYLQIYVNSRSFVYSSACSKNTVLLFGSDPVYPAYFPQQSLQGRHTSFKINLVSFRERRQNDAQRPSGYSKSCQAVNSIPTIPINAMKPAIVSAVLFSAIVMTSFSSFRILCRISSVGAGVGTLVGFLVGFEVSPMVGFLVNDAVGAEVDPIPPLKDPLPPSLSVLPPPPLPLLPSPSTSFLPST